MTIDHYDTIDSDSPTAMLGVVERGQEGAAYKATKEGLEILANTIRNKRGFAWSDYGDALMKEVLDFCEEKLGECKQWRDYLENRE